MKWYFGFFLVSGFCSILYELVWLRLAMADFAVTTALVSIVLSIFMLGLGLGSWVAGHFLGKFGARLGFSALRLYALAEFLIGVSALLVPRQLLWGRTLLERIVTMHPLSATAYYVIAGTWITLALVPWCACMGATFPLAMFSLKRNFVDASTRSFSYLYVANIFGAGLGTVVPLLLIEVFGFHGTLRVGSVLNITLAACAFLLTMGRHDATAIASPLASAKAMPDTSRLTGKWPFSLLFATGLTSMGVEVVWVRLLTPWLGNLVYAFAAILGIYLAATFLGSRAYRTRRAGDDLLSSFLLVLLGFSILLPLFSCDPRVPIRILLRLAIAVIPFSFLAGWLTPMILDRVSGGDADRAGKGYAINITGCILGPLVSGFVLLPWLGERRSLCAFALPWLVAGLVWRTPTAVTNGLDRQPWMAWKSWMFALGSVVLVGATVSYENQYRPAVVLRDHTATIIATGSGRGKRLLVNGIGMTFLTPITKMMVHMPLAFLQRPPQNALVICFGMGTSHRSMLSWGIRSTAVELVPSVPRLFSYYHSDGARLMQSPLSQVVIDDGRFYLERTSEQFDVIAIDPPPPVEAAGSSLLYTREFYAAIKPHLRDDAILQQWVGNPDPVLRSSMAKALQQTFPYVRAFVSMEGWGLHFLASKSPIPRFSPAVLASHLPPSATVDLLEWGPSSTAEQQFALVLNREVPISSVIQQAPSAPVMEDDRPINEYFLLRRSRLNPYLQQIQRTWLAQEMLQ
jgi:predicted membrane-bound spermidine synthase